MTPTPSTLRRMNTSNELLKKFSSISTILSLTLHGQRVPSIVDTRSGFTMAIGYATSCISRWRDWVSCGPHATQQAPMSCSRLETLPAARSQSSRGAFFGVAGRSTPARQVGHTGSCDLPYRSSHGGQLAVFVSRLPLIRRSCRYASPPPIRSCKLAARSHGR